MRKLSININNINITILLILMINCFDLIGTETKIMGIIKYSDILFIYCIIFFIYYLLKYKRDFFSGSFAIVILFVPILVILSAIMSKIFYGQSILKGVLTQRAWLITMFLYFPIHALIKNGCINYVSFVKILYRVAFFQLLVLYAQYLIGDYPMFLKNGYTYRYGSLRLVVYTAYIQLVLAISTYRLMKKQNVFKNVFFICTIMGYVMIINKGRAEAIICIAMILSIVVLSDAKFAFKFLVIMICISVGCSVILKSQSINEFINIIINNVEDGTYNVRLNSRKFYINTLSQQPISWLFGYGIANSTVYSSNIATGVTQGYLLADNGLYGFIFSYGIMGVFWYIFSIIIQIKKTLRIYFRYHDPSIIVKVLLTLATYSTYTWFFYTYYSFDSILIFTLIELIFENYKNKLQLKFD